MTVRGEAPSASAALRAEGLRPRKHLGQNFLRDASFLPRIVTAGDVRQGDAVLEIGAGTGVLTDALLQAGAQVTAVELDDRLFSLLETRFDAVRSIRLWHGNALDFDPATHFEGGYKLVANIPYYITGPILRHFLEAALRPQVLVLMVQREVAARMVAGPGELSLLGVSVQYYATPHMVARVPAGAFYPPPKVDSAIVRLVPHEVVPDRAATEAFFTVARAGFSTKRKQLVNSIANGLRIPRIEAQDLLGRAGIDERRRAEELTIAEWEQLASAWRAGTG